MREVLQWSSAAVALAVMIVNLSALFLPDDGVALGTSALLFGVGLYNVVANDLATIAIFITLVATRVANIWIMYPLQTSAELNYVMYYICMLYWLPFFPLVLLYGGDNIRMLTLFIATVPMAIAIDVYSSGVYPDLPLTSSKQAGWVLSNMCFACSALYVMKQPQHVSQLIMGTLGIAAGTTMSFTQNSVPQGIASCVLLADLWAMAIYVRYEPAQIVKTMLEFKTPDDKQEKDRE